MSRMLYVLILVWFMFASLTDLYAQYVNTDSLIHLPGYDQPVSISEFHAFMDELQADDLSVGQEYFYGQFIPAGNILRHFNLPSKGRVISRYGMRSGRMHTGTDIKMNKGDTIYAVFQGMVTRARYYNGYGNMVVIDHGNDIETSYAHLSEFLVNPGDVVHTNEPIGLAGSTGRASTNHLHFELKESNKHFNPELVFDFEEGRIRHEAYDIQTVAELQKDKKQVEIINAGAMPQKYIVASGDSLWKISRRYKTSVKTLCQLNNLSEQSVLNVGMELKLF